MAKCGRQIWRSVAGFLRQVFSPGFPYETCARIVLSYRRAQWPKPRNPANNPPIPFKPGQAPQLRSRDVTQDRQRCTHSCLPFLASAAWRGIKCPNSNSKPGGSKHRRLGITGPWSVGRLCSTGQQSPVVAFEFDHALLGDWEMPPLHRSSPGLGSAASCPRPILVSRSIPHRKRHLTDVGLIVWTGNAGLFCGLGLLVISGALVICRLTLAIHGRARDRPRARTF